MRLLAIGLENNVGASIGGTSAEANGSAGASYSYDALFPALPESSPAVTMGHHPKGSMPTRVESSVVTQVMYFFTFNKYENLWY